MPIQIIDNFYLNSAKPIDNRFVVGPNSFYTHRDFIDWKFEGMRVWDLNDGLPYVWTGTTYSSENTVSIGGSGTSNKIPKFTSSTTVGDSNIYDDGVNIAVGHTSPVYKLDVAGSVRSTVAFYGDASVGGVGTITNIDADKITLGTLALNRLQNSASANFILTSGVGGSGQSAWTNPSSITVGNATSAVNSTNATNATNVNVLTTSINSTFNLLFVNSTGNSTVYTNNSSSIKLNPSNARVFIGSYPVGNFSSQLRIQTPGSVNFDAVSIGNSAAFTNLRVITNLVSSVNSTRLQLWKSISGGSASSHWGSFGSSSGGGYDEVLFSGRTYINTSGSGTNDSRTITFGNTGTNDQIRFHMIGNSNTVPTVGGYGVYIERNLQVDGTFSSDRLKMSSYSGRNYANDLAAAAGGISLGEFYHNAGALRVRIA